MDQGEGVFPRAPWCARSLGIRLRHTIAVAVFKACTEECLPWGGRVQQGASWRRWCARATPCPRRSGGRSALAFVLLCCSFKSRGALQPAESVGFAVGTVVHADALQLLPFGGAVNDTLWQWDGRCVVLPGIASAVVPGPQASPINPEMAPFSVSVDGRMHQLPAARLPPEAHHLEELVAVNLQRVVLATVSILATVSNLAATAELPCRLGRVGVFFFAEEHLTRLAVSGDVMCVTRVQCVRATDAAARSSPHPEEAHPSVCLRVLRHWLHSPTFCCRGVAGAKSMHVGTLVRLWVWAAFCHPMHIYLILEYACPCA
jgi:hypothetical protein